MKAAESMCVLVVEDEPAHVILIERALETSRQDMHVLRAASIAEARARLAAQPRPLIALVDLHLPDGSGLDLLRVLVGEGLPVVVMTSHGDEQIAVEAIRGGAMDYVVKSASAIAGIAATLERALRAWRSAREHDRAIEEATRLGRMLEDSINEIVVVDAGTLEVAHLSRSAEEHMRLAPGTGHGLSLLRILQGFSRDDFLSLAEPLVRGEARQVHFTAVQTRADGTLYPVESHMRRTKVDGRPAFVIISLDISERVAMEEERRRLEAQLRHSQKMQTIGTLSGGIAHDFNNLLTPIIINTHMVLQSLGDDALARTRLERVACAANRARDLVKQILMFSRQLKLEIRPVHLPTLIADALGLLDTSFPTTLCVESDVQADCGWVLGDETQLHQVLVNLCTNASHAIGDRPGHLRVALRAVQVAEDEPHLQPNLHAGPYALLTVADTGEGMDRGTRERVFDPFFTTKAPGKGTGLGLSVVHGIVMGHGGAIAIESQPGQGTTVLVYLPIAAEAGAALPARAALAPAQRGDESVLFVDDEPENAHLGREMLEPLGYRVTVATDGRQALELLTRDPWAFDVVVTDHAMPELNGLDFADAAHALRPGLPFILLTDFAENVRPGMPEAKGLAATLHKPVLPAELSEAIQRAVAAGPTEENR